MAGLRAWAWGWIMHLDLAVTASCWMEEEGVLLLRGNRIIHCCSLPAALFPVPGTVPGTLRWGGTPLWMEKQSDPRSGEDWSGRSVEFPRS